MGMIQEQPMLYKKAKTGKIVSYRTMVVYGKEPKTAIIVKQTGQLLGLKTVHTQIVVKGKNIGKENETTPIEQAISQMESNWRKKKDEGYKTIEELDPKFPRVSITPVMPPHHYDVAIVNTFLLQNLGETNTDAEGNLKPMLATAIEKVKDLQFPVLAQPKLDGARCFGVLDDPAARLLSRGGKFYRLPHISEEMKVLYNYLKTSNCPIGASNYDKPFLVDGEMYNHKMEFEEIISAVKALKSSSQEISLCIYDVPSKKPMSERFKDLETLKDIITNTLKLKYIKIVPTYLIDSQERLDQFYAHCVAKDYEGAMVRTLGGLYEYGARSSSLLKVKKFDSTEYPLVKFTANGHRGIQDLKAIVDTPGGTVDVPMNGTIVHKQELWDRWSNGEYPAGTLITVAHFGFTNGDKPRFPKGVAVRDYE